MFCCLTVTPSLSDEDPCKEGREAFDQLNYEQAINNLGQCLETAKLTKPEKVEIYKTLGFCYLAFEITWQAKIFFKQAIELDPMFDPTLDPVWGHKVTDVWNELQQNETPDNNSNTEKQEKNTLNTSPGIPSAQPEKVVPPATKTESTPYITPPASNHVLVSIGNHKRFSISECGTIVEKKSGLEWLADPGKDVNYAEASEYAYTLEYCGRTDWRLPTRDELANLKTLKKTPCYGSKCKGRGSFKIDPVFKLGGCCPWSMETQSASNVWGFDFSRGSEFWLPSHHRLNGRVLVVRKSK